MLPPRWRIPSRWLALSILGVLALRAEAQSAPPARISLSELPGMDFSQLSVSTQKELETALNDDFCFCGCPHSLAQCLKLHTNCGHAKRATKLAALSAQKQMGGQEIALMLEKYFGSFGKRHPVKTDERMCQGQKDAKVTVVEYSDFECPYCATARPILEQFAKENAKKVRFCYAPFPLSAHPHAMAAGAAALFARDRGKFWAMHDGLFENQSRLSVDFIEGLGAKLGLPKGELAKALSSSRYVDELTTWKDSARAAAVDSTPSIFFNGRKFELPLSVETLKQSLDDELEWMAHAQAWASD